LILDCFNAFNATKQKDITVKGLLKLTINALQSRPANANAYFVCFLVLLANTAKFIRASWIRIILVAAAPAPTALTLAQMLKHR
jgi:hypothetical protein